MTTSGHLKQPIKTSIYVPQKKRGHVSVLMTIIVMLDVLHINGTLSKILMIDILGSVKLTSVNVFVQKGLLSTSTVYPQIKLLNKQLTKSRGIKAVLLAAAHQREQYKSVF